MKKKAHGIIIHRTKRPKPKWPAQIQRGEARRFQLPVDDRTDPYAYTFSSSYVSAGPRVSEYAGMPTDAADFAYALSDKMRADITRFVRRPAHI